MVLRGCISCLNYKKTARKLFIESEIMQLKFAPKNVSQCVEGMKTTSTTFIAESPLQTDTLVLKAFSTSTACLITARPNLYPSCTLDRAIRVDDLAERELPILGVWGLGPKGVQGLCP
jgi:hypothetical protein